MDIQFLIEYKTWQKLLNFCTATYEKHQSEVSGYMTLGPHEDGYIMENPELLEQKVSGRQTEIEGNDIQKYITKYIAKLGKDTKFVWWHTHPSFDTLFSNTDDDTINKTPHKRQGDFATSLCLNLKGECNLRISIWNPFRYDFKAKLLTLNTPTKPKIPDYIYKEIENKVSKHNYSVYNKDKKIMYSQSKVYSMLHCYYNTTTKMWQSVPVTQSRKNARKALRKQKQELLLLKDKNIDVFSDKDMTDELHNKQILNYVSSFAERKQLSIFNLFNRMDWCLDQALTDQIKWYEMKNELLKLNPSLKGFDLVVKPPTWKYFDNERNKWQVDKKYFVDSLGFIFRNSKEA